MENQKMHLRQVLFYYFRKGKSAVQACEKLREVYDDEALEEHECRHWYARFFSGDYYMQDAPPSNKLSEVIGKDKVKALIEANSRLTVNELAETAKMSVESVSLCLVQLDYINMLDVWVPRKLKEVDLMKRMDICEQLLKREQFDETFLYRMITGDEKWIAYNIIHDCNAINLIAPGNKRGRSITEIDVKKAMLSVWWNRDGVVFFELLPENITINSDIYCQQLDKLNEAIARKPRMIKYYDNMPQVFHHDNSRPYTTLKAREKLSKLQWDVLPYPPHSPDLAPPNCILFQSLQETLNKTVFCSEAAMEAYLADYFSKKDIRFFIHGIMNLSTKWRDVIEQKGQYIINQCEFV